MIVHEIAYRDPLAAFSAWADEPFALFLDSAVEGDPRSRFTTIVVDPFRRLVAKGGRVFVDGCAIEANPFDVLEENLAPFKAEHLFAPDAASLPPVPFSGGAVGFLGYDLRHALVHEHVRWQKAFSTFPADGVQHREDPAQETQRSDASDLPDMAIGFYDTIMTFDTVAQRAWIVSTGLPETSASARTPRALARLAALLERLEQAPASLPAPARPQLVWQPDLSPSEYQARVQKVIEHIHAGDIFQANFTGRFSASRPLGCAPFDLYRLARDAAPGPFSAFANFGPDITLASVSPERFLRMSSDGAIEARPIKGTRPRGATSQEDAWQAQALAASEKDRAENVMIVDLLRSDIGRIAEIGSIQVPSLHAVETFPAIHHLVSSVEGQLRAGLTAVDVLRAAFPGGSITGAPKIQAMKIIDALETAPRGPYCGALAWIGWDGAMDSSILIRTAVITRDGIVVQAGGGIVADSDPAQEYQEMLVKARPLLNALGQVKP